MYTHLKKILHKKLSDNEYNQDFQNYLDQNLIPDRVLFSTYELAFKLLSDSELSSDPSVRQFRKVSIDGVLSVDFNENALPRALDRNIMNFISPLLKSGGDMAVLLRR